MYGNSMTLFESSQDMMEDISQDFILEVDGFGVAYINLGLPFLSRPQKFISNKEYKKDKEDINSKKKKI